MALQPPHLHLLTSPECSTLGKLFLKVEKVTLIGDVKTTFKLQGINFSVIISKDSYKFETT